MKKPNQYQKNLLIQLYKNLESITTNKLSKTLYNLIFINKDLQKKLFKQNKIKKFNNILRMY